jgi:hypothetical protein
MKKEHLIIGLLFFAMFTMFVGCGEGEEALGPTLQLHGGDYIDSDETVAPGAILEFSWHAQKGDAKLESMTITRDGVALSGWDNKEIPSSENEDYTDNAMLEAPLNDGAYSYELIVADKDGLTASQSIVITVEAQELIYSYTVTLGSPRAGSSGSPCLDVDAASGNTYTAAQFDNHLSEIDIVFFNGTANGYTISSPDNKDDLDDFQGFDVSDWASLSPNSTSLKTGVSANFDDIESHEAVALQNAYDNASGSVVQKVNQISSIGEVIAFRTIGGKYGLINVDGASPSFGSTATDATITISVKVQK